MTSVFIKTVLYKPQEARVAFYGLFKRSIEGEDYYLIEMWNLSLFILSYSAIELEPAKKLFEEILDLSNKVREEVKLIFSNDDIPLMVEGIKRPLNHVFDVIEKDQSGYVLKEKKKKIDNELDRVPIEYDFFVRGLWDYYLKSKKYIKNNI